MTPATDIVATSREIPTEYEILMNYFITFTFSFLVLFMIFFVIFIIVKDERAKAKEKKEWEAGEPARKEAEKEKKLQQEAEKQAKLEAENKEFEKLNNELIYLAKNLKYKIYDNYISLYIDDKELDKIEYSRRKEKIYLFDSAVSTLGVAPIYDKTMINNFDGYRTSRYLQDETKYKRIYYFVNDVKLGILNLDDFLKDNYSNKLFTKYADELVINYNKFLNAVHTLLWDSVYELSSDEK
ncbi:cell envelope integrity protein TolA [Arcobacter sp. CECT 9188]|uniref:cell envelope integrity protein TolA n=1 Tax=Arcobacter sp. CECT 9188 TaxID=2044505 RepID=UPI000DEBCF99|nr:cell envelope integrity protein TolA [Arcobacter sp. CECT 9188]RBQ27607.1 hypothetical protein CRU88_02775 [Arcobacter sp. CECT 9188]